MKKNILFCAACSMVIIPTILLLVGCTEIAKVGEWMQAAGETGKDITGSIAPIADSLFPGSSIILGAITGLLSIAGGFLVKISNKRLTTIQAITEGVSFALKNGTEIKSAVSTVATTLGVEPYLNKLVQKFDPPALPEETKTS